MKLTLKKSLFNEKFYPLLQDYSHRWEIYMGSAGSGKSYSIACKLVLRALKEPGIRIMVTRKYGTTLKETVFSLIKDILKKWKIIDQCHITVMPFNIKFPNGSEILFSGLDDETKLLSLNNISCVWVEEAYEVEKDIVEQLDLRMRGKHKNQQIILSFNPISKASWLYDFVSNPPASYVFHHSTYKDNKFLSKEYIQSLEEMRKRNPAKARIYCDGEWGTLSKLVFENWSVAELDDFNFNATAFGLDFGYVNDPSAFVACKVNTKSKEIYIFDELYQSGLLNDSIAHWITYKGYSKEKIIADSAEQKSIDEIKRAGISHIKPAIKGQGSIMWGIDLLNQYHIFVNPRCENMIMELENYSYKKDRKTGEYINEPEDAYNHLCDALRYAIQTITKPQFKTMSKAVLGL